MLDIKFVRENKDIVKENIKKKFQDEKLGLVDEVIKLDQDFRGLKTKQDESLEKLGEINLLEGKDNNDLFFKEKASYSKISKINYNSCKK